MKKWGCMLGTIGLIGGVLIVSTVIFLIISSRGTSLRYTIDGLVIDSPHWELKAAVGSGDSVNILRAFTKATYRPVWSMSDAIPTMQSYLTNPNPLVRCYAAKALYMFGDQSGYSTLLDLVNSNQPMIYFEHDLRIDAIETLAQYWQKGASQAIYNLYSTTDEKDPKGRELRGAIIEALITLAPGLAKTFTSNEYYAESSSILDYGLLNDRQFLPQITSSFQSSPKQDVKIAAAWALATMTNDKTAADYLFQTAQVMLKEKNQSSERWELVKCIGSIQDPRVKPLLEQALDCNDATVVQLGIVNLLYNQGGSEKAKDVLAQALYLKRMNLPWDFVLEVASQFKDDPKIQEAGQHFAQNDVMESWQLWTGDRKQWPIYNWINGCILKWNKAP